MLLIVVFFLLPGEGGLEVRGHGHWPDIPLDVCIGLYPGICGIVSPSLVSWNDLEHSNIKKSNEQWQMGNAFPYDSFFFLFIVSIYFY